VDGTSFPLTPEERKALVVVLYVVRDNWWLTDTEQGLLDRLEAGLQEETLHQLNAA